MAAIRNLLATWTTTGGKKPAAQSLFEGHTDVVRCLAFTPDGALLASGSSDGTVRL
ncbi:MAG TPA: WD40 repeat domain-containing protein, partial [Isosphaeraceae bacterium]|nr:WD40 repeat domain-containing protein [Isosphaeraceae bacterium]